MTEARNPFEFSPHAIGQLCVGGDWACAHGDLETLGHIAKRLAERAQESLHGELVLLAELCRRDADSAVAVWLRLKDQMLRSGRRQSP